jgi:hypothetical protein
MKFVLAATTALMLGGLSAIAQESGAQEAAGDLVIELKDGIVRVDCSTMWHLNTRSACATSPLPASTTTSLFTA